MDLNLSFVHLCGEVVIIAFCFPFYLYLIEMIPIAMVLVQHVIELSIGDCWPYNDFLPVCKATAMIEWRNGILVVHMLQLLLGSQTNLYQVGVEAAEAKDENAEQGGNEGCEEAPPVCLHRFTENLRT